MSIGLLDVNVLIALLWPEHVHHHKASVWFGQNRSSGWATCTITETGFARITAQPAGGGRTLLASLDLLGLQGAEPDHSFWSLETPLADILPEIKSRLAGHQQLTDAILLDLAIRRGGHLITLDQGVKRLLPPNSPHQGAIVVIPDVQPEPPIGTFNVEL